MRVVTEVLELAFRDPFRIARKLPDHGATSVIGTITDDDGEAGTGEGYPDPYYGETSATVEAVVPMLVDTIDQIGPMPVGLEPVRAWLVAAALLLGMLGFAWAYFTRQPASNAQVFKFSILPPEKSSFGQIAVSPDGRYLAFTAAIGG